jgi:hypothetical protein
MRRMAEKKLRLFFALVFREDCAILLFVHVSDFPVHMPCEAVFWKYLL